MSESRDSRWIGRTVLGCAILFAAYTGFRAPNLWSVTLQTVSVTDGFHKRFLVGTLLRPLAEATSYNYWLFAAFSYAVLMALVVVVARVAITSPIFARRVIVIVWFLLPTGGFLFHEVGYFEQVLYLIAFGAIALVQRDRVLAAMILMVLAPLVHEIAALTILPIYTVVIFRKDLWRSKWWVLAAPVAVNAIVLVLSPAGPGAVARLSESLSHANFAYRADALELFQRSHGESRALFDVGEQLIRVGPVVVVLVAAFAAVRLLRPANRTLPKLFAVVVACCAIAAPGLLAFGGWDSNRWVFFVIANFFIMLYLAFDTEASAPSTQSEVLVLVAAALLITRIPLYYFDQKAPRDLGLPELEGLLRDVRRASFWSPKM